MATFRAASGAFAAGTTSTTLVKPAGSAAGDFVCFEVNTGTGAETFTIPSGWNKIEETTVAAQTSCLVWRTLDGSANDADPTASWVTSGRVSWTGEAWTPAASSTLAINVEATVKTDGVGATSETANAATPTVGNTAPISIIFSNFKNNVNVGAVAITSTPPTNWTEPANGDQSTNTGASVRQVASEVCHQTLASNATVTPGAHTVSAAVTTIQHHILLIESAAAAAPNPFPRRKHPSRRR